MNNQEELKCINCNKCILDENSISGGYYCDYSGCKIDDPEQDYCETEYEPFK